MRKPANRPEAKNGEAKTGAPVLDTYVYFLKLTWFNVVSGLGLHVQDVALFIKKTLVHFGLNYRESRSRAKRCPFASMSVFERDLLSE